MKIRRLTMGLFLTAILACGLVLPSAVMAQTEGGIPSIDVVKEAEAVEGGVVSTITITNSGDVDVNVTKVTDTVYWQIGGGDWDYLAQYVDETGYLVVVDGTLNLTFEIPCEVPEDARELRNVVEVEIDGRDKVFHDIVSFAPFNYMPEIEFEGIVDSIDPDLVITTGEGDTYTVVTDADTQIEGEPTPGDPAKVEGVLQPDGTVLASKIEGTEIEIDD
jgi:hypothetical protein